jgi:hypothetical protein
MTSTRPGATEVGASVAQFGYNRLDHTAEQGVLGACRDWDLRVLSGSRWATAT